MVSLRNSRNFVVKVGCHVVLEQVYKVLYDQRRGSGFFALPDSLIYPQDVHDLVSKVVLDLIPDSSVMDGLTTTGGTGKTCSINQTR